MKRILDISPQNDIKFKGPFTYQTLRIFGWFFLILAQIAVVLTLKSKICNTTGAEGLKIAYDNAATILKLISTVAMPLFLVANFGFIMMNRDNYRTLIILYVGLVGVFITAFELIYFRYGVGLFSLLEVENPVIVVDAVLGLFLQSGASFNVFVDLLLCTLMMLFIDYYPKSKIFAGKKIIFFRLFALIPLGLEVTGIILKMCNGVYIDIPMYLQVLLPSKPAILIFVFVMLLLFVKGLCLYMKKKGKTEVEIADYYKSNHFSLMFALILSTMLIVASAIDFIIFEVVIHQESITIETFLLVNHFGVGECMFSILIIPIVIFFSFSKQPKHVEWNKFIPLAGAGLIGVVYIEGLYQVIELFNSLSKQM